MKTRIYFLLLIFIFSINLFAQIKDVPFKQATSVKYTLSEDLKTAKFKKVVVDYNDIVYVLTDKGLFRDYNESELSKDMFYRLLATKKPVDITVQESTGYLYYLYADEFLTNAHAGVIYKYFPKNDYQSILVNAEDQVLLLGYPKFEFMFYGQHWSVEQQDSILKVLSIAISERAKGNADGSELLRQINHVHPIRMNHAPRNTLSQLRLFSKSADIVGCDIYPGKKGVDGHNELHTHRMSSVGGYTDIMQNAAPNKPICMVLQGFSWDLLKVKNPIRENLDPKEFPSYKHSRVMAWNAILHSAKGILYWGSYMVDSKSLFWNSILGVTKEIATLEPFLLAPEMKEKIKIDPIQFTSSAITRVASTLRKHNDDYLLVVLQEDLSQSLNVSGLDFLEGKTLYELTTDRTYVVKNGKIRVWFGKEPHVLCTSKKYDVVHESQFSPYMG